MCHDGRCLVLHWDVWWYGHVVSNCSVTWLKYRSPPHPRTTKGRQLAVRKHWAHASCGTRDHTSPLRSVLHPCHISRIYSFTVKSCIKFRVDVTIKYLYFICSTYCQYLFTEAHYFVTNFVLLVPHIFTMAFLFVCL